MPDFRFSLDGNRPKVTSGGWAKEATVHQFPISKGIAGVHMFLDPGGSRELPARQQTLRDTIGTAIQVNLSTVTIEETEITKRLAAWAGIFAVATAFAGIWGMNFQNMPELKLAWGYPAALVIITLACAFMWWRFRRAKWL